ncbi:formylglycine-generating enzyme family protein [[Phormidium] sp. ETS-05]|uniref:formylglycine-generating enzyme family protein n=1 Tax=[Phormidium] sp. ETS-05 TaxID=222819 RepID=UPI0018EF1FEB|nr:formylglycine-generating enzyme family protein [[Phormidium] sp. ETS-05]
MRIANGSLIRNRHKVTKFLGIKSLLSPPANQPTVSLDSIATGLSGTNHSLSRRSVLQLGILAGGSFILAVAGQDQKLRGASTFAFTSVTVNARGRVLNRINQEVEYFSQNLSNGVLLDMVAIPGGTCRMGSPNSEPGRYSNEGPQHQVTIKPFHLSKYPITQAQWEAVMGNNPSYFQGANLPVDSVSWFDAVAFCQKLSQQTGITYRLPSEAEWEYACRANSSTPFHFGDTITAELANYDAHHSYALAPKGQYRQQTTAVGSFSPNAFGIYDMHGQVWEWCQDVWHPNYHHAPADGTAWETEGEARRVLRGGSWYHFSASCRSASRDGNDAGDGSWLHGFRVVAVL